MKRKILGLTAVVLALSLSSFVERPKSSKFGQYYWFPLDNGTGWPLVVSHLVYQSYDPYLCTNWAWGDYCAAAYTSYTGSSGSYSAAGFLIVVDYHILPL